jgi:cell division inhibitor SepF
MASAMRKMAVYLGLVEDDHRYQDGYESYEEYEEYEEQPDRLDGPEDLDGQPAGPGPGQNGFLGAPVRQEGARQVTDLARITTLHPRTYNEARTIGEHFREGIPVIMNLT